MNTIEFTDRYKALGIRDPDPETVCKGPCEGTGIVPIHRDEKNYPYYLAWNVAHRECGKSWWSEPCDGWHFVRCRTCGGTGKKHDEEKK